MAALAAIALIVWLGYSGAPAPSQPSPILESGNSVLEIEQDLDTTQLEDIDSDFASLEQEAQAVP